MSRGESDSSLTLCLVRCCALSRSLACVGLGLTAALVVFANFHVYPLGFRPFGGARRHGGGAGNGVILDASRPNFRAEALEQAQRDVWLALQGEHAWLEDALGSAALQWVQEENNRTIETIGDPRKSPLYSRLLKILESEEKIPLVAKHGSYWYNVWHDGAHPRGLWRRTRPGSYKLAEPKWEVMLDIDALSEEEGESWVWKGHSVLLEYGEDGRPSEPTRTMVRLSPGGSDAVVQREFDLKAKRFIPAEEGGFVVAPAAKSRVAWRDLNTLIVGGAFGEGSLTSSGYAMDAREWARGTPLEEAAVIFRGKSEDVVAEQDITYHRSYMLEWQRQQQTFYTHSMRVRFQKVASGSDSASVSDWIELTQRGLPESAEFDQFGNQLLVWLKNDWSLPAGAHFPSGSLLSVALADFQKRGCSAKFTKLYRPSAKKSLYDYSKTKNYLVLTTLEDVKPRVHFLHWLAGEKRWDAMVSEPKATIRRLSITAVDSQGSDDLFVRVSTFTHPETLFLAKASAGEEYLSGAEPLKHMPSFFNADGIQYFQKFAESADGTKVPYFVICKIERAHDGSNPTVLYGYGGFEISLEPYYMSVTGAAWLEAGGCWAIANIRGGGEYGPSWHQSALKEHRQRAYDDFIAVAEDLIDAGITSRARLAIKGGSNGGLLVGNIMAQRPELFQAVLCQVPLIDMKRYTHIGAGASWVAEYGDPDTDDWGDFLQRYSPYHNVCPRVSYPWLLMTTSTKDDRVHPYHARCLVKRLHDIGKRSKVLLYENTEGGHYGAADAKQSAYVDSLEYMFLRRVLRLH